MRFSAAIYSLLLVAAVNAGNGTSECGVAVATGRNITINGSLVEHGSFPWHVAIYRRNSIENFEQICAGTLVSPKFVISAAYCFFNETVGEVVNATEFTVVAGKYYRLYNVSEYYAQESAVQKINVGSRYFGVSRNYDQDIALVRLKTPFVTTALVMPVCMDWENRHEEEERRARNSGMTAWWGITADGNPNAKLQEVHLPFISNRNCPNAVPENFESSITADKFWAGYSNGSRSGTGDRGSGLYLQFEGLWYLRGITSAISTSNDTCDEDHFTAFTNVRNFLEWINTIYFLIGNHQSGGVYHPSTHGTNDSYDALVTEYGSCPWRQPNKRYSEGVLGLHEEIEDYFLYVSPTIEERKLRLRVIKRIEDVIRDLCPDCKIEVFGSYRTGLILPTSDIDLRVIDMHRMLSMRWLAKAMLDRNIAEPTCINVLDGNRIQLVTLTDKESQVKLDISLNNDLHNGAESAELIESYKRQFPVLEKLVMVLKQFLRQLDLNKSTTGGITSYGLTLMTINFLQLRPKQNANGPNDNLGVLLIEFLELYGRKFNYLETAIRVKDGGARISKEEAERDMIGGQKPSILCIEDPFVPGKGIGQQSSRALYAKEAFDWAYSVLSRAVSPLRINDGNKVSILGRIIRIADEVVEHRKWIKETFPVPLGETDSLPGFTRSDASTFSTPGNDTDFQSGVGNFTYDAENNSDES